MPKDKVEAAIKRASGQDAADYEEVIYEGYAPARRRGARRDRDRQPDAHRRERPQRTSARTAATSATTGSVASCSSAWACSASNPAGIDQDDLELDLIDHGLEEMGESTGEKGEPQLVVRCAFADFGTLQKALEDRGITPISAEHEYICQTPIELPEDQANEVLELIDKLEQDDDVQKVFHTLA